ncbi:MAG: helix-turn-helix domain-containing protein [Gemmatimonadaceae bacterium]|jgi:AraC family transcriptional regulator|nr:helix-turn-helix domain-containing protein [Gemmatimonadaceae bacterium]
MSDALLLSIDEYCALQRQPAHAHDALHLSLIVRGTVTESVGAHTTSGRPFSVVCKDAGVRHANAWGPSGATLVRLSLDGGTLGALLGLPDASVDAWRWRETPMVARAFLAVLARSPAHGARVRTDDVLLTELLAALTVTGHGAKGVPPAWLRLVVARAREEWHPSLTGSTLAREAGVHSVYLARCLRRWYGVGLAELLRIERARRAGAMAVTQEASLSRVAHTLGFSDEAHQCRSLRSTLGISPGRLRALLRTARTSRLQ